MNINFNGKRVLVTGAGKGIGREICILLAKSGAKVIAVTRTAADLDSLKKEINCETIAADLADAGAAKRAAEQALKGGPIQLLVNNAGISIPQPFLDTTPDAFDKT